jgi:hypothetical protein
MEFFELNLRSMTIDEYEIRFLELLKYVYFIKDDHGLPLFIIDKIQYDDPKTLEETIKRDMIIIEENQLSKNLGKTRRKSRWNKGIRGLSHHSTKIILRDIQLLKNPE